MNACACLRKQDSTTFPFFAPNGSVKFRHLVETRDDSVNKPFTPPVAKYLLLSASGYFAQKGTFREKYFFSSKPPTFTSPNVDTLSHAGTLKHPFQRA
jgi:hypothetical protein